MTANEKRLLRIFWGCAFGALILPLAYLAFERKKLAERSIDTHIAALSKIERFDQDIVSINERIGQLKASLGVEDPQKRMTSFSDFAADARALLIRYGIEPIRYQVVGVGDEISVEFSLRCDTLPLMKFLRDASEKNRSWAMPLVSIHPDKTGQTVNAVIRIRYAK
jgi:hypothetical protein